MNKKKLKFLPIALVASVFIFGSCSDDKDKNMVENKITKTITIENVLDSKLLVESGTFQNSGASPVIFPGNSVSFSFYAGPGQSLSFATMYGLSNDLFFATNNPGIKLYDDSGKPITGDVSSQVDIWDNGTRVNESPGANVTHPGVVETTAKNIKKVGGTTDDYGHTFLAASQLMSVSLAYNGNSNFTVTISNISGGKANETPFSPGVWAISYVAGGNPLMPNPIYTKDQPSANGLTNIAEAGMTTNMSSYLTANTGLFTGLSPVLVVVYKGDKNPFFQTGEKDRGEGLKDIAQTGNADALYNALKTKSGVKSVYVLKEATTTALLPRIKGAAGGKVSQMLTLEEGDKISIATMFGSSSDWFYATKSGDIKASVSGDVSSSIELFDNGTTVDQYPGAGIRPAPSASRVISVLPNPNQFTTIPTAGNIIKVTLE